MEIHSAASRINDEMMAKVKEQHTAPSAVRPFQDPIREFHRASSVEGTVRHWLTLPVEQRKKYVETLTYIPRHMGDPSRGVEPEAEKAFENRLLERWRALCVIVQEESRAAMLRASNSKVTVEASPEVAIRALKLLFPDHPWPKPQGK